MAKASIDVVLGRRYRLIRQIATGGMGSVWEAQDLVLHRRVAVKVLSDAAAPGARSAERFRREALSAAGLSHPAVASVYDYGEDGGQPFIVMELVEGETLGERLARPMAQDEAVRIAVGIASALQAAHDAGIIHRDVKPGNVMLTPSGDVRVLDFGISAAAGVPLTSTGARMGTATYLSPEQVRGEPPTAASDVYSLGVVLYEMLAGRPPFMGDSPVAVAAQHADQTPPPITDLVPDILPHVARTVDRALAKDPSSRPTSADAFASMLTNGSAAAAIEARREPDPTRILPPREPTAVLAAGPGHAADPEPAAPWRPRGPRWRIWAIAGILVALALAGMILFLVVSGPSGRTPAQAKDKVAVPRVVGLSSKDAAEAIRAAGLDVGDVVAVDGPSDRVTRTDPPVGSRVARGSTVTLYVGTPPEHGGPGKDPGKGPGKDKGNEGHGGEGD